MGDAAWQFRGDSEQVRRNTDILRQIVADGRRRLDGLPRAEAARAELLSFSEDWFSELPSSRSQLGFTGNC